MNNKILVTYASRTGYTIGVAESIYKTLVENGIPAEFCPMEDVNNISSYKGVIIGSALQDRQWLPEAMQFVKSNKEVLKTKPVATFTVCMTLAMKNADKYLPGVIKWIEPVREIIKPKREGYFAGGLSIAKIPNLKNRIMFRLSVFFGVWKEGDHRDWNKIHSWAESLKSIF